MHVIIKRSIALLTILAMLFITAGPALSDQELDEDGDLEAGKMAADALVVRPLGFVAMVLGSAVFLVSLPFSIPGGNTKSAFTNLMGNPASYTFNRPLGDF